MPIEWARLNGLDPEGAWLRPLGFISGHAAAAAVAVGRARPLGGSNLAFTWILATGLGPGRRPISVAAPLAELEAWIAQAQTGVRFARRFRSQLAAFSNPPAAWAGFPLDRPLVMGVLNVTPDSFSDGGRWFDRAGATARGHALLEAGADIIDVGGESTRPGAEPVPTDEEIRRVEPFVRALVKSGAVVSIDTRHAKVMDAALDAGARIVNDVSALTHDPGSLALIARRQAPVVLMHMRGEPQTMQRNPVYASPLIEVLQFLETRVGVCVAAGIPRENIAIDPGIGFVKLVPHNLELIAGVGAFHALGHPVVLGASRKSMIARLRTLTPEQWAITAEHEEYSHYGVFIMFRHIALHDLHHVYKIEERLLRKHW